MHSRIISNTTKIIWLLSATILLAFTAQAQTYTVLHAFTGYPDGDTPDSSLILDGGNLFGTTYYGGRLESGVVFSVKAASGEEFSVDNFSARHGIHPEGAVARDSAGNLYGTTMESGGGNTSGGVVFKTDSHGHETVLYTFGVSDNLFSPRGVIRDSAGNLYGTAAGGSGGNFGLGVVYKLDTSGSLTVLYNSQGGTDGDSPNGPLIRDALGNIYGTTFQGGTSSNLGTVFKLDPNGIETVLYRFAGGTDGLNPNGGLVIDPEGNLYGTTSWGGTYNSGTIFKVDTAGNETVLHSFGGGVDGSQPFAGLVRDSAGNFYGTTSVGGALGGGAVFKCDGSGQESVLYSFTGGAGGSFSQTGVTLDGKGNLYGTLDFGGNMAGACSPQGCGLVFKLALP